VPTDTEDTVDLQPAARQAGAAGLVLILRSGAEITLCFPDGDKPAQESGL
jgi:hypothetical protein